MELQKTIVIIGGGYAGINLITQLKKEFSNQLNKDIKIILIDKNAYHLKKVKLFKAIVEENVNMLHVPLTYYCGPEIEFIQGVLTNIHQQDQKIFLKVETGEEISIHYDHLVLALGSVVKQVSLESGGISLNSIQNARKIREDLINKLHSGINNLRIAIVGGGITGIETSAELMHWLKMEALNQGIPPGNIEIALFNNKDQLLCELPIKISKRLENRLIELGVSIHHHREVTTFQEGKLHFANGEMTNADYCIWTVGVKPHPSLQTLDLTLTEDGKVVTDSSYHCIHNNQIYSIGDCAHIIDPSTGELAGMTCKEAISQAQQLVKIIKGDIQGYRTNVHRTIPTLYCIGLGPTEGMVWTQKWGIDIVISGKIGAKIREYTWNLASIHH
ncbi:MAG TPA: FAD-dependent oxidoreductase [Pseudoneobacillus sp.]|nr:FAD-dependent oxidoreductase [Pseudoneobacillus sp.]